jgi:hypothetical protein
VSCAAVLNHDRQEELPINIGGTTTHGRIDEDILWFELTDESAAISIASSKHLIVTISVEACGATVM